MSQFVLCCVGVCSFDYCVYGVVIKYQLQQHILYHSSVTCFNLILSASRCVYSVTLVESHIKTDCHSKEGSWSLVFLTLVWYSLHDELKRIGFLYDQPQECLKITLNAILTQTGAWVSVLFCEVWLVVVQWVVGVMPWNSVYMGSVCCSVRCDEQWVVGVMPWNSVYMGSVCCSVRCDELWCSGL